MLGQRRPHDIQTDDQAVAEDVQTTTRAPMAVVRSDLRLQIFAELPLELLGKQPHQTRQQ